MFEENCFFISFNFINYCYNLEQHTCNRLYVMS
uniref:Uncharacterized protein n=1 Tax=Anguilla anguilla TaxID=7936 RepID=A0A0E9PCI1_ANGAN